MRRRRGTLLRGALLLLLAVLPLFVDGPPAGASAPRAAINAPWPTYHHDNARTGLDASSAAFTSVAAGWSAGLDGALYAEPLVAGTNVYAATENNTVYAFNANTGVQQWSTHLGTPVDSSALPCGNVDPVGITGTPVIDPVAGVLYVVAFIAGAGSPPGQYVLYAVDLAGGTVRWHQAIAPAGFDPSPQGQRSALAFANGYVYAAFGGRAGDCGTYHGWVVGTPVGGGTQVTYQTPNGSNGAIWATSGAAVDAAGDLYVSTGNGGASSYDYSDSVLKLSPTLGLLDSFAPSDWSYLSLSDTDLGSVGPALLNDQGLVFQIGKGGLGYLLRQSRLSSSGNHIGGELFSQQVCHATFDAAFGGTAYAAGVVYVPCNDGLVALTVGGGSFSQRWYSSGFFAGPPIVVGGVVWDVSKDGNLRALDPATGTIRFQQSVGAPITSFPSVSFANGRLFVQAGKQLSTFVFAASQAPAVTQITPNSGPSTGGTSVAITGAGFTGATAVHFGSAVASFTVNSDTSITAVSPPLAAGTVDITVTTPAGTSTVSASDQFTAQPVGGAGFRLMDSPFGVVGMTWQGGTAQTGYVVVRANGSGTTLLPPTGPLPAFATSLVDIPPASDQIDCYAVAPLSGIAALGVSDVLCRVPDAPSLLGAPSNFSIALNQSTTAALSWMPPGGQSGYTLASITPNVPGATWVTTGLPGSATSANFVPSRQPTCFLLVAIYGQTAAGDTNILCGVPGQSTLAAGAASGSAATRPSLSQVRSQLQRMAGSIQRLQGRSAPVGARLAR